jgi:hypothetical protein
MHQCLRSIRGGMPTVLQEITALLAMALSQPQPNTC